MAPRRRYQRQPYEVGVYGILNRVTGKWYVGSSIELSKRMGRHLWELRTGRHHSQKLQRSFDKHGESAFEFKILLACDERDVHLFEQRAINGLKAFTDGYNVASEPKGGFMRGRKWPEGTKAARLEEMKGRRHSEEVCKQISRDKKEQWADPEQRKKMTQAMRVPKSTQGAANIAAASQRRRQDPALAEARRLSVLKAWETRRANKAVAAVEVGLG